MSGPKTSELLIERMIAAQLEAWQMDVDDAVAAARRAIAEVRDRLLAQCAACAGCEDTAVQVREAAERALMRLREECSWMPAVTLEESQARAERCQRSAAAIAEAFRAEMAGVEQRIGRLRAQEAATEDATDFMALLARAFDEDTEAHAATEEAAQDAEKTGVETLRSTEASVGATSWSPAAAAKSSALCDSRNEVASKGDREVAPTEAASAGANASIGAEADLLQDIARRALALVHSPHTLPADRDLLLEHGCDLTEATAPQLALLLPAMEANERAMADLVASIYSLREALGVQGVSLPAVGPFGTLEEASACLEDLRARQAQAVRNAYLQTCIDKVMADHGYTVTRSVSMGRDLTGAHRLFGAEGADAGIHAFLSDKGDLMLSVAGLPEGMEAVGDGATVTLEGAEGSRAGELLEAQRDFCAVYDEIAADLAALGITNAVRYRAESDTAFSRDVRIAEAEDGMEIQGERAAGAGQMTTQNARGQTAPYTPDRRRKRSGSAAREMR